MTQERLNRNAIRALSFLADKTQPMSIAEMRKKGLDIPRSSLFTTMDMLSEGIGGRPLIRQICYFDGRTNFRFVLTDEGITLSQCLNK